MATLNQAQSFLLDLHAQAQADAELAKAYESIPEMFIQQAREGFSMAYINAEHVTNIRYSNTPNSDFFRVVIQDCLNEANGISFKVSLQGIHDAKRNMIATDRNKSKPNIAAGEGYVRNFSSQRILLTQSDIDAGILTADCFEQLKDYTNWWESISEKGPNMQYNAKLGYSKIRRYLVAKNEAYFIGFQMEVRTSQQENRSQLYTIGIKDIQWSNVFVADKPGLGYAKVGQAGDMGAKTPVEITDRTFHAPSAVTEAAATAPVGFSLPSR